MINLADFEENERIYTIPLRATKQVRRTKRAPHAMRQIRKFIARHMKTDIDNVWIDPPVNRAIWSRGIEKPPSKIRVRAIKFEDELVEVSLPED